MSASEPAFVEANGLRFAYLEEGEGPLVLLLHGFPDTAHSWDDVLPALAEAGYRAVAPWTRGYHPTAIPADGAYDGDTLGRDVVALLEALSDEPAFVVGHDWGASAAYAAVGTHPERIRGLVTVAIPHPASMKPSLGLLWNVRHFLTLRLPGAARRIRDGDYATIDALVRRWSPTWNPPPEETEAVKEAFAHAGCLEAALGYYAAISPKPPAGHRKRVTVPTAAFAGEDDIIAPEAFDRAASRFESDYEVIRMPGGHFMHREHPERFRRELLRVLEGWSSG